MEHNTTHLNDLFLKAKTQEPQMSTADALLRMHTGLTQNPLPFRLSKFWVGMLVVSVIGFVGVLLIRQFNVNETNPSTAYKSEVVLSPIEIKPSSTAPTALKDSSNEAQTSLPPVSTLTPIEPQSLQSVQVLVPNPSFGREPMERNVRNQMPQLTFDEDYPFPTLTPEQIENTLKEKKQMLKDLMKQNSKTYAYIPSGSVTLLDKEVSVQSFFMRNTEITNLEYRTFLFDLLIQGRKAEFLKAKPNQQMWTQIDFQPSQQMQNLYFSDEAYNSYPVVNVPFEGAQLYCRWLTNSLNQLLEEKGKNTINNIRLPSTWEFRYAASSGGKDTAYPWPFNKDTFELPLANFKNDSLNKSQYLVHAGAFFDNEYGLRNMSGNCAEWCMDITAEGIGSAFALGGGWMDEIEALRIDAAPTPNAAYTGHPNVGFRVVFTYLSK